MKRLPLATKMMIAALTLPLLAGACAQIRKVTYPPDFVYLERTQIRNQMTRLAMDMWEMNDMFETGENLAGYRRERVIELLREMQGTARLLGSGTRKTNHLLIDNHIDQFERDVTKARAAVEAEPPSYYLAGRLSGSCLACHVQRRTQ